MKNAETSEFSTLAERNQLLPSHGNENFSDVLFLSFLTSALCVSVCFNMSTGMAVSQSELMPSPTLHCALAKGVTVNNMGET